MIKLLIDTASNQEVRIGIVKDGKAYSQKTKITSNKTQIILPMIDKILKKHAIKLKDVSAIEINPGPGSFTGLRVGLAIANALSFILKIPINGEKAGSVIAPVY